MGVHAAGTQQGLSYKLAPLEGKRAGALKALMSRAPVANVPFPALQSLIWQIAGGLGYARMPRQSQLLVDQLIPDFRNELNEDFVVVLQQKIDQLKRVQLTARFANELQSLLTEYERVQQNLQRNADNFENLSRQFVNVIPGTAPNAGPSSWSKLNSRVYARLTGGNVYGQVGNLEIRVVPSQGISTDSGASKGFLRNANFNIHDADLQASATDQADIPLDALIAYPNNAPGMQGLGLVANPPSSTGPTITSVSTILPEPNPTIVISGSGFGSLPQQYQSLPSKGDSSYFRFQDSTRHWEAGYKSPSSAVGDLCNVTIAQWTDNSLVATVNVNGPFSSLAGIGCALRPSDAVAITVWNPANGLGATTSATVNGVAQGLPSQLQCRPFNASQTSSQSLECGLPGPNLSLGEISTVTEVAALCDFFEELASEAGGPSENFGEDSWIATLRSNSAVNSPSIRSACDASSSAIVNLLISTTKLEMKANANPNTLCFVPRWGNGQAECVPITSAGSSNVSVLAVSSISPSQAVSGSAVTITGSGFKNVTAVKFGGALATYTVVSPTTIRATVPDISSADRQIKTLGRGSQIGITVTVTTSAGGSDLPQTFYYAGQN